jgi:hypothetical protein
MVDFSQIKEHAKVIGADGVRVGAVELMEEGRLKLAKVDGAAGRPRYLDAGLIADVEDGVVRLSATAAVAITLEDGGE